MAFTRLPSHVNSHLSTLSQQTKAAMKGNILSFQPLCHSFPRLLQGKHAFADTKQKDLLSVLEWLRPDPARNDIAQKTIAFKRQRLEAPKPHQSPKRAFP